MTLRSLAAGTLLLAVLPRLVLAQHALLALPLDDVAYVQLDGLTRAGCHAARVSSFRPYFVERIRDALSRAAADRLCQGPTLDALRSRFIEADSLTRGAAFRPGGAITISGTGLGDAEFRPLWRDVRPKALGTPPVVAKVNGRVTWDGGPRLHGVADAYAVSSRRNDPTLRGRGFRGSEAVVDFAEASLTTRVGPLFILFGRGQEAWLSEGRESLMLSAHGPPLDKLVLAAHSRRWQARAVVATLPDVVLDAFRDSIVGGNRRIHRLFAAHAISVRPVSGLELVLGETALLNREGGGVDLAFLNPAMIYLVTQNDTGYSGEGAPEANLTTFASARLSLGRTVLGAELTVDDIQIDSEDRKRLPDQLAWRMHASRGLPTAWPSTVGLEYRRADSYTYLRSPYSAVYQHYDAPLGSELGPGADEARVTTELFAGKRLRLSTGIGQRRQGALRLEERPSRSAFGHAGEVFPSTVPQRPAVQKATTVGAGIQWLSERTPVSAFAEWASVTNVNNAPETSANYLRVNIVGSYRFRYP